MRRHSITTATPEELHKEIKELEKAIAEVGDDQSSTAKFRRSAAQALIFSIKCKLGEIGNTQEPAPAALPSGVVSLAEYRARKKANG